ncbi:hypothetical protein B9T07_04360 [Limnospira fusiformis CCALA 023]|uniref:ParB N-terminal domain-containing protein n=1 Tax=Arthrospira sp. PCC 8006 TaxID=1982224 RepID=UPI00396E883B
MIRFSLVDVKSINSHVPRSNFSESELEELADNILECGEIIKPLILKMQGLENYQVISGNLEYYAAVKAREKDPRKAEMVNAFVIADKHEAKVLKQVELIERFTVTPSLVNNQIGETVTLTTSPSPHLESRLNNLEQRLETYVSQIQQELRDYQQQNERRFKAIESPQPSPMRESESPNQPIINPLDLFNSLTQEELLRRLNRANISNSKNLAKGICEAREKLGKFINYQQVIANVKGLADKTMIKIIDAWSS